MLYKNTLKKVQKSFGRYLSIFLILLVAVGFFTGLQSTVPDIIKTSDDYYRSYNLMDFKILSSMGLSDSDVRALKALENVKDVIPSYSLDLLDQDKTLRVSAVNDSINKVKLVNGRMPEVENEALADFRYYKVGDTINIVSDTDEKLSNTLFTVVGTVQSVLFLSEDYGSTSIGDGKLLSFAFIPESNFILDAYTEIYITIDGADKISSASENYHNAVEQMNNQLEKIKHEREKARYMEIIAMADEEIDKNEEKLLDEKADAEKKFSEAKTELDDSAEKLNEAKKTAEAEFSKAKNELDINFQKISDAKSELLSNETELNKTVQIQNKQFEDAKIRIAEAWIQINNALQQYGITKSDINQKIIDLESAINTMEAQLEHLSSETEEYANFQAGLEQTRSAYEGLTSLRQSVAELSAQESELSMGIDTFNAQITESRNKIESAKEEIAQNEQKIQEGYEKYRKNLYAYTAEMAENEKNLEDGYKEYNENMEKFNSEISNAIAKIADARNDIYDIEMPTWYINDRDAVAGYSDFNSAIDVIEKVAVIFPLLFIAIVMLMTSNSMTRMIAEERSELGTLSSLGFNDSKIIGTYLLYVLSASILGTIIGFFIGSRFIPPLIYATFKYSLPPLIIRYDLISFTVIMLITIILMSIVTITACRKELREKPAMLMRPVAPKIGQKIILERLGFIWNRLSFTWKVTMRNIFRYKKRALMTIIGVASCASFLVVGFGLRDSMNIIIPKQYGDIFRYRNMSILKEEIDGFTDELSTALKNSQVEEPLLINQSAFKVNSEDRTLSIYLIVPENTQDFKKYFNLRDYKDKTSINLDHSGVVITQKIAEVYSVKKGDTITVQDSEKNSFELKVDSVAENYASSYIYMNNEVYSQMFGEKISYNTIVASQNAPDDIVAKKLIDSGYVLNTMSAKDIMKKAVDGNESLNSIVTLIVLVSSMLALLVLYNLTSINISERTREIATLKVLGFRDDETNAYIYREALLLALMSTLIGMGFGVFLHSFVIDMIEGDMTIFFKHIKVASFLISFALTMLFSVIMQIVTYFKLKKINMIESLKSVE